jgi:hypothetical protein
MTAFRQVGITPLRANGHDKRSVTISMDALWVLVMAGHAVHRSAKEGLMVEEEAYLVGAIAQALRAMNIAGKPMHLLPRAYGEEL